METPRPPESEQSPAELSNNFATHVLWDIVSHSNPALRRPVRAYRELLELQQRHGQDIVSTQVTTLGIVVSVRPDVYDVLQAAEIARAGIPVIEDADDALEAAEIARVHDELEALRKKTANPELPTGNE